MKPFIKILSLFTFLLLSPFVMADSTNRLSSVKLQLKWQHQFQFAGYYAAIEKGYYREAGLDVSLIEAKPGQDSLQAVLSGDEFIVVIKNLENDQHLQTVIEKIDQIVKQNIVYQKLSLTISASIGFSLYPKDSEEFQQLITLADESMYKIKGLK